MNPLNSTSLDLARLRCYLKDGYQKPEKILHFFHNALKIRSDSRFRTKLKSSINLSKTKRLSNRDVCFFKTHTHLFQAISSNMRTTQIPSSFDCKYEVICRLVSISKKRLNKKTP